MHPAALLMATSGNVSGVVKRNLKHPTCVRIWCPDQKLRETHTVRFIPAFRHLEASIIIDGKMEYGRLRFRKAETREERRVAMGGIIWVLEP